MHALLFHISVICISRADPNSPVYCIEPVVISEVEILQRCVVFITSKSVELDIVKGSVYQEDSLQS